MRVYQGLQAKVLETTSFRPGCRSIHNVVRASARQVSVSGLQGL